MNKFVKYLPILLLLSLFLGIVLGFPTFVTIYIVEPVAVLLWAAWRIVASVDQNVYWALLIVLCSMLMIRVFSSGNSSPPSPEHPHKRESATRVERWQALFTEAARTDDSSAALRDNLGNLLVSIIGQVEQHAPANVEEALCWRQVPLPPAARRYLLTTGPRSKWWHHDYRSYVLSRMPGWFRRWAGQPDIPDSARIHELLGWMESVMEIRHDR